MLSRGAMEAAEWGSQVVLDVWKTVHPNCVEENRRKIPDAERLLESMGFDIDFKRQKKYRRR